MSEFNNDNNNMLNNNFNSNIGNDDSMAGKNAVEPIDYQRYVSGETFISEPSSSNSYAESISSFESDEKLSSSNTGYTNSRYFDTIYNGSESYEKPADFFTTITKPRKKKKYISAKAAVLALVFTALLSIIGGAALSGYVYNGFSDDSASRRLVSVDDNINSSSKYTGSNTTQTNKNSLIGKSLSTPEIVDTVGPAVVGIINKTTYGNAYGYFGSFYGDTNDEFEQSSGSGVIISSDGYIVTNNHVVENATALTVILNTGEEYTAKLIGRDSATDLAVIKIDGNNLTFAQMGNSSDLRVGEIAIAIGNPLGQEFAGTTTQGIISGLNRSVTVENKTMNLIQTDAAINPGNSGGALVDEHGLLIGINTVKISSDVLEGLGFAIPIDEAKPIIKELMTNGYVTGRPVIGIGGRAVTKEDAEAYNLKVGVYVSSITPNGPAFMAGIKVGDIIVECEGEPIETVDDINKIKNKKKPGDKISIKVYRKGDYSDLDLILGEEVPLE